MLVKEQIISIIFLASYYVSVISIFCQLFNRQINRPPKDLLRLSYGSRTHIKMIYLSTIFKPCDERSRIPRSCTLQLQLTSSGHPVIKIILITKQIIKVKCTVIIFVSKLLYLLFFYLKSVMGSKRATFVLSLPIYLTY